MIVVLVLLAGFFVFYIATPFFQKAFTKKGWDASSADRENLVHRKEEILEAIRDLEYDYHMRKITESDYLQLKENLARQAVAVMKKLDTVEGKESLAANRRSSTKLRS